jgi:hypothetical protein
MIRCTDCDCLCNNDPDGMVLVCKCTGQNVFVDDLPFTVMSRCPKKEADKERKNEIHL